MANYHTPGVYVQEIAHLPPVISGIAETVPAFIGYTATAAADDGGSLHLVPTRISSMLDYRRYFGGPQIETALAVDASETVDESGAGIATDIQISWPPAQRSRHIMDYAMQLYFANGGSSCYIVSAGPYSPTGNAITKADLEAGLQAVDSVKAVTLLIMPEAQILAKEDYKSLHMAALKQCAENANCFLILDVPESINASEAYAEYRTDWLGSASLRYGATYAPSLDATLAYAVDDASVKVRRKVNDGAETEFSLTELAATPLYQAIRQRLDKLAMVLPPSPAVAAVYSVTDNTRSIWKAPANVALREVSALSVAINDQQQGWLNVDTVAGKSINVIRKFHGKPDPMVWGARTLAGNDNEWRYIPVVRMISGIRAAMQDAMQGFVFEANDANTWVRISTMVENFLTVLWRNGAMQGAKTEHAFFVTIGLGKTMSELDILEGRLILEIGVAAVRPAEFIIFRVAQQQAAA